MSIFDWFADMFSSGCELSSMCDDTFLNNSTDQIGTDFSDDFTVNPANGLTMIGGIGGMDVEGNPYGTDFSHDHMASSGLDDNWLSSSSSSIDDSWNSSSGSSFSDW